ncbi:hypothetical protein I2492_04115 [Budviciaceae bacterium CWB-B4]|uniref:Uncharacterized protein n=1 Tax=Limnobaculum xujianqingii TaxID=2738837 RepID=A0A9D7AGE5_9GAMM|nr:hypothetical protein [Limnobaculum xujianqingii]MBK5072200.1 hypothetical protein [Limnobaculum xujianqingii]MBK5175509.1 hypothetical protein [Limnobaculum xujianqingii]
MSKSSATIDEIAITADNLQSLLCILHEREPQKLGGAEVYSTIGLAWDLACTISSWLEKEVEKND